MSQDEEQAEVRRWLGAKLKQYREGAQISVNELAKSVDVGRQYVYLVENGKANFTIDSYVQMLRTCGVSFQEVLAGLHTSDIPAEHQPYHRSLSRILNSGAGDAIQGIRASLTAFAEQAIRLQKARGQPNPPSGREKDLKDGKGTGSPPHKKHKAS